MENLITILTTTLLKSAIVLLVALVAVLFMRRSSAAARHLMWAGAVAGVLALPVLSFLLPGWSAAPVAPVVDNGRMAPPAFEEAVAFEAGAKEPRFDESATPSEPAVSRAGADRSGSAETSPVDAPVAGRRGEALPVEAGASAGTSFSLSAAFWQWAPWIWLGGASFALLPLVLGTSGLFRLKRTARRVKDPAWLSLLAELCSELKVSQKVRLLESPVCTMPMTWGALPGLPAKIVVPEDALDEWTPDRRRAVLLHELAHVKRRDCLTQTLSQFGCALYWPNPLIWVAAHRMLVERERACDDLALRNAMQPSEYAKHLLEIATGHTGSSLARHAAVAMARPSGLGNRLVAVLDQRRNRKSLSRVAAGAAIALLGAVVVPVAMLQAEDGEAEIEQETDDETLDAGQRESDSAGNDNIRVVRGRVLGPDGEPVAGAVGMVSPAYEYRPSRDDYAPDELRVDRTIVTDEAGEFTIEGGAAISLVTVRMEAEGLARRMSPRMRPGEGVHELVLSEGASVTGRVLKNGEPLADVEVGIAGVNRNMRVFVGEHSVSTNEHGEFRFENLPARTEFYIYGIMDSLQGHGVVPAREMVTGDDGSTSIADALRVDPGFRLEGRVRLTKTEDSAAILEGAVVSVGRRNGEDVLDVELDAEGRFRVSDVPPEIITITPRIEGYRPSRNNASLDIGSTRQLSGRIDDDKTDLIVELEPGDRLDRLSGNPTILRQEPLRGVEDSNPSTGVRVSGTVVDAETGEPLPSFTVTDGQRSDYDRHLYDWFPTRKRTYSDGEFATVFTEGGEFPAVMIEAEGYLPVASDFLTESENDLMIELERGTGLEGTLLRPDGTPAEGVTVLLLGHQNSIILRADSELSSGGTHHTPRTVTDASGRFSFEPRVDDYGIIAADDSGYVEATVEELTEKSEVQLQPWARVEGRLMIGAEPGANERVNLNQVLSIRDHYPRNSHRLGIFLNTTTDQEGRFVFERVPPVKVSVHHSPDVGSSSEVPISQLRMLNAAPGEVHRLTLGGKGRPVVGRVVAKGYWDEIDWRADVQYLRLNVPVSEALADIDELLKEGRRVEARRRRSEFDSSEEGRAYHFAQRQYALNFSQDGSFRIEDVPGGRYTLEIELREPDDNGSSRTSAPVIGTVERYIEIPESPGGRSDEPYDLGGIEL